MKHEKLKEQSPMTDLAEKPFEENAKAEEIKQVSSCIASTQSVLGSLTLYHGKLLIYPRLPWLLFFNIF
jgi:hypothetical protein